MSQRSQRRADVVILTAIKLEFDAVLQVEAGAVAGSSWTEATGPSGLPVVHRRFVGNGDRPLRVAVALAPDIGATAAVHTLLPLVAELEPRCVAMCGVCAGRRNKVALGDVVAADRLYYHDTGRQLPGRVEQDLTTYKLRDDWKLALERMDPVALFGREAWFLARPLTTKWRKRRVLVSIGNGDPEPWTSADSTMTIGEWQKLLAGLKKHSLVAASGRDLTPAGRRFVDELLFKLMGKLPDASPAGPHRLRLHVAPMGSGTRVIEDEQIWTFVSQTMRKTLGIEMEAAAIGELAHRQRQHQLDWVVLKSVMDFADHGRDDHFKDYAARVSAECLLWFLREHVVTQPVAGFDDVLEPRIMEKPPHDAPPSRLLGTPFAVVPWHSAGRTEVMATLDSWADAPSQPVAMRLLHAPGGAGKTRLAMEWLRRRRDRGDTAGFLPVPAKDGWLARTCGLGAPVVAAIDYAETRADLIAVLGAVAARIAGPRPPRVRILLLARSDGDWWEALLERELALKVLLTAQPPIELPPLATGDVERQDVFNEALDAFAGHRRRPVPRARISTDDPRFDRVLYLHMAALSAVERHAVPAGAASTEAAIDLDAGELMDEILDHEQRFWSRDPQDLNRAPLKLARQLVAAATLRGGVARETQARQLCKRISERERTDADDELLEVLHGVYAVDEASQYLPGLQPDLLGEAMVLRVASTQADETWIERVIVEGDDAEAVGNAFTVLGRAAAVNPAAVSPWITTLLRSDLAVRALLALRAAKNVGQRTAFSPLGDLLADAMERNGTAVMALALSNEPIPHSTVSLRRIAKWHTRAAVKSYRVLATRRPEAFLPRLARGLNNLGVKLSDLGQREPALAATQEAMERYRALAADNPDAFASDLAVSLNNLGAHLSALGQRQPALTAAQEAVDHHRALAARDPDAFASGLARSLSNLGKMLSELGQHQPALTAAQEAVDHYRALAARHPDAFTSDLALGLDNLGGHLSALGQRQAALTATQEAVDHYRGLAAGHPDAFTSDLARSLTNLGGHLSALGQHQAALTATQEAVDHHRALAARHPDAFASGLARSLTNLGKTLSELGQHQAALTATQEAVDHYRALAARHPDAFASTLALSLTNLGKMLSDLGQRKAALTATQEAVAHHRALAARHPDAFASGLALSLNNLGKMLSDRWQFQAALTATQEAVDHYRVLAARHPDAFASTLALSLKNLRKISIKRTVIRIAAILLLLDAAWLVIDVLSG